MSTNMNIEPDGSKTTSTITTKPSPKQQQQSIINPSQHNNYYRPSTTTTATHQSKQSSRPYSHSHPMPQSSANHTMNINRSNHRQNGYHHSTHIYKSKRHNNTESTAKQNDSNNNKPLTLTNGHEHNEKINLSPLQIKADPHKEEEENDDDKNDNNEFEAAYFIKMIAFDLDKTLVRTISLHTNDQPQPEQYQNGYFMFFDDDTKEYHHVYKRPYLQKLLDFLYHSVHKTNACKMMLCTHGTQKYAQTILEKCGADKLFPIMLPRKDWMRRKFEDDYKPRRFKTIDKMAKSVNMCSEDVLMIDDDPGVYNKNDRCFGSLLHILPFDDPYEQRNDTELNKLINLLTMLLKYGKNYYNNVFCRCIRYTGLVKTQMIRSQMAQHSLFRAELIKRLMFDFGVAMDREERLGCIYLFDRYVNKYALNWELIKASRLRQFAYYVLLLFGCLFIIRQYLYVDSKRPKQFRRDPYSAHIWLVHVEIFIKIVKKYKTLNGKTLFDPTKHHINKQKEQEQVYPSHSHHRRRRKHKNKEKQIYFVELHKITKEIVDGIGYPKILHGLYHRPSNGFDASLFVKYEDYVDRLFRHIEKTAIQNLAKK